MSQTLNNVTDKCHELVWEVGAEVSFPDLPDVSLHWNLRTYLPTGGRLDADADDYHGEIMRADQEERTQEYNRLAMEQRLLSMAELWRLSRTPCSEPNRGRGTSKPRALSTADIARLGGAAAARRSESSPPMTAVAASAGGAWAQRRWPRRRARAPLAARRRLGDEPPLHLGIVPRCTSS